MKDKFKNMKKRNPMKTATIVLGVVLVIAFSILFLYMNRAIRIGVNTIVPEITKTTVRFKKANLSVFTGKGEIIGLVIGNPHGFNTPAAFVMKHVKFMVDPTSFFSNNIIITNVFVDGLKITYEVLNGKSNIGVILNNIEYPYGTEPNGEQAGPSTFEPTISTDKWVFIKNFIINDGVINVNDKMLQDKAVTIPLATVEYQDIGKNPLSKDQEPIKKQKAKNQDLKFRTVNMQKMALTLIKAVSESVVSAIRSSNISEVVEIKTSINNLGDAIKNEKI